MELFTKDRKKENELPTADQFLSFQVKTFRFSGLIWQKFDRGATVL